MVSILVKTTLLIIFEHTILELTKASEQCENVNTVGHGYEKVFKVPRNKDGDIVVDFYIKSVSDGLIIFTTNIDTIQTDHFFSGLQTSSTALEIVIGGGGNTFSAIRSGSVRLTSREHTPTPNILSPNEFRGFSIKITTVGKIMTIDITRKDENVTFLSWNTKSIPIKWFGLSSWTNVRAQWRINCVNSSAETDTLEEVDFNYTGEAKLRRDLTMFYDTSMRLSEDEPTRVELALQMKRILMDERKAKLVVMGTILMRWTDNKLAWSPSDYDNVTSLHLQPQEIWTPSLNLYTGLSEVSFILPWTGSCLVEFTGRISWKPTIEMNSYCHLNMEKWPHNTHNCTLFIGVLGLETDVLNSQNVIIVPAKKEFWEANASALGWNVNVQLEAEPESIFIVIPVLLTRQDTLYNTIFLAPFFSSIIIFLSAFWLKSKEPTAVFLNCFSLVVLAMGHIQVGNMISIVAAKPPPMRKIMHWSTTQFLLP